MPTPANAIIKRFHSYSHLLWEYSYYLRQELRNPVKPDQDDAESPLVEEKQAELSGEVDDQSVSAGVLNAKSRSWIPYTLAFLACIGFGGLPKRQRK